jgi:hypothetical protein
MQSYLTVNFSNNKTMIWLSIKNTPINEMRGRDSYEVKCLKCLIQI